MSARVICHPEADPQEVWPSHAKIDGRGATMAVDMLCELEGRGSDAQGVTVADYSALADWPRQGRPFRNVVAEYAAKAQAAGPEVFDGFCAVLSDFISIACLSRSVSDVETYDRFCEDAPE